MCKECDNPFRNSNLNVEKRFEKRGECSWPNVRYQMCVWGEGIITVSEQCSGQAVGHINVIYSLKCIIKKFLKWELVHHHSPGK